MRDTHGEYRLVEINPRFPAWIYLSVGVGRNLPEALVLLALGETLPNFEDVQAGTLFIRYAKELIVSLADYESVVMTGQRRSYE
jgi:carbamoyl-phosphate synthase large subunit